MSAAAAAVLPLHRCPNGGCGKRATATVGGMLFCPTCAATIRESCDRIFAAKEEWEASRRRELMAIVRDQYELPLAAGGET